MASPSSSIAAILVSTGLFLMGNGLIGTLTPLRAHLDGFSDIAVGTLGTWYFAGFVLGCFAGPHLLSRVGHIRAFAVRLAGRNLRLDSAGMGDAAGVVFRPRHHGIFARHSLYGDRELAQRSGEQ